MDNYFHWKHEGFFYGKNLDTWLVVPYTFQKAETREYVLAKLGTIDMATYRNFVSHINVFKGALLALQVDIWT